MYSNLSNMLALIFLCFSSYVVCSATTTSAKINHTIQSQSESRTVNESIREYLKKIEKSSVKTIKSPDGDIIDCVPYDQQPAFDHPLLQGQRNKTITLPEVPKGYLPDNDTAAFDPETFQVWRMSGESCPENTVPIRRASEEEVLRVHHRKALGEDHEHALVYRNGEFYGGDATLNVWFPRIGNDGEFSLAQMWVMSGRIDDGTLNSIEAGWQVRPGYGSPHFFIFWTTDGYQRTGCYDFQCPGYCQVDPHIAPGLGIAPVSHYNSNQQQIRIIVWKAPKDQNWWLAVNGVAIGYWSKLLFPRLGPGHAELVEFGGEIVNHGSPGQHTTTQMGSGHFPGEGFKRAAFMKNLRFASSIGNVYPARGLQTVIQNSNCYDLKFYETNDPNWGTYMYYGGPGKNWGSCI